MISELLQRLAASARSKHSLWAVLFLAAAVRIPALIGYSELPFFSYNRLDAALFHEMAANFANGEDLFGDEVVHMSPLYAGILAGLYSVLGVSPWVSRVAQLALGLCTVAFIYLSCKQLYGERWALLGGAVSALYGPFVFFEHQISVATLSTALYSALLCAGIFAFRGENTAIGRWVLLGAAWGLAVLARANAMLLGLPLMFLAFESGRRRCIARSSALLITCAVFILPITIRNCAVAGEAVLVTDSGGLNFYIGNGPDANGTFRVPKEVPGAANAEAEFERYKKVAEFDLNRKLSSKEVDAYWYGKTFDYIQKEPGSWIGLMLEKSFLYFHPRELSNTHNFDFHLMLNPALHLPFVHFRFVAIAGLIGVVLMLLSGSTEIRFAALFAVICFASVVVFFVLDHYRVPTVPALIVAGVYFVKRVVDWFITRNWKALSACGVAAAGMFLAGTVSVFEPNTTDEYFKLGFAYHQQGELENAARAYGDALKLEPNHLSSLKNYAMLLESKGMNDKAIYVWRRLEAAADKTKATEYGNLAARRIRALSGKEP